MTTEQAEAFTQLRTLAAASRLRVRPDDEGWPIIPGRLGQIEWYCNGQDCHGCPLPGEPALAVYTDHPRLFQKLWAIPGVRRWQTGDRGMRAVLPPEALEQVASVIRARRRRIQSPAQTQNLAKAPRSAGSRPQDRAEAGAPNPGYLRGAGGERHNRDHSDRRSERRVALMLVGRTVVEVLRARARRCGARPPSPDPACGARASSGRTWGQGEATGPTAGGGPPAEGGA